MGELKQNESIERMRQIVCDWLASENWSTSKLVDWFQGYDLPALGHEEEPYLWLLRGIPDDAERYQTEKKLATRAAVFLREQPDVKRPGQDPDQVLYNLLMFCAGLSSAHELADPLFEFLERRRLEGKWRGVDLRTALKSALITNQRDARLVPVWEESLINGHERFLTIDEYDFIDAARLIPGSIEKQGTPALDVIGKALRVVADRHDRDEKREQTFFTLANKVIDTYPRRPSWGRDLLIQALKQAWPRWAIEVMPANSPDISRIIQSVRMSPYKGERSARGVIVHGLAESAVSEARAAAAQSSLPCRPRLEKSKATPIQEAHVIGLRALSVGA
jgi:hypothetical protein